MDERALTSLQDELREELLPWLLVPYWISGLILAIFDRGDAPPPSASALGMLILILAAMVWVVCRKHYRAAAWLVHLGSVGLILLARRWLPTVRAEYALLYPIIGAAITLGPRASIALATLASLVLGLEVFSLPLLRADLSPLLADVTILWSITFLVCVSLRPQRTMVAWAWQGYQEARRHLENARDRQVELKRALEDLALASSETVRLNEMLAAARNAVEEARKAKEEFVANVSHELRTPLNMIIGFSDMILESPEVYSRRLPPALLADVAAIKRNSQHLASLVDDVLDLAELDTGRMQLSKEWTSIQDIVGEATEAVAALFEKKGLSLVADVQGDTLPVYCDHTRIRQVILNLLSNAARFTERGGTKVRARLQDGSLVVSVSDTGPGMLPEKLDRLFEPFQQGDPSIRRRYGGTGLGLSISKRFVELHGGKIWLESEVDAGTTASFTLPIGDSEILEDASRRWFGPYHEYTPRTRRSVAPEINPKPRVVVLEQGKALSRLVARYLEDVEAVHVACLEEAGRAVEANAAIALLINDVSPLAVRDALTEIPKMGFDVPIMSCWVPEAQAAFTQIGAQDYLVKPVSRSDLLESIVRIAPQARSILLVDDDAEARQLFRRMLASADRDYVVLPAGDGQTALSLLRERQPNLLLLDLIMPNFDGFAVLEAKARDAQIKDIPVIIISAKDPQREPIVSKMLAITRQEGLSARDLMLSLKSVTQALKPRFGAPVEPETTGA